MELINSNNIYIDIGDGQYKLIKNEYIYEFKNYYFKKTVKIKYANHIFNVDLRDEKYFQIRIINVGNFILLYVFNKKKLLFNKTIIIEKEEYKDYNYDYDKFLKYKLLRLIYILKNKLGKEIKLPEDIIFNINSKLNIIEETIDELNVQKILYYIQYIKNTFSI